MPPIFGYPSYYWDADTTDSVNFVDDVPDENGAKSLTELSFWYIVLLLSMLFTWILVYSCLRIWIISRQKTRRPQERRMYMGSRSRPSLALQEPTIYVSPSNYPPPPKYDAMAPPSYEEVVGVHYPSYQSSVQPMTQPITQPITAAMTDARNETSTVITVTSENRRTSVAVASI